MSLLLQLRPQPPPFFLDTLKNIADDDCRNKGEGFTVLRINVTCPRTRATQKEMVYKSASETTVHVRFNIELPLRPSNLWTGPREFFRIRYTLGTPLNAV